MLVYPGSEPLPDKIDRPVHLHLWLASESAFIKLAQFAASAALTAEVDDQSRSVCVALEPAGIRPFAIRLAGLLTREELKDTRVLYRYDDTQPRPEDISRLMSLRRFITVAHADWLLDLIAEERVTCLFQPIVYADDTSRLFGHEALLRGIDPDGAYVSPAAIFNLSRDAGMFFQVETLARRTALSTAIEHRVTGKVFINFHPSAVYDPEACLYATAAAVDAGGLLRENIVFEVASANRVQDLAHLQRVLHACRETGFGVSLDDSEAGHPSLHLVEQLRLDYVRLGGALVRDIHLDPYRASVAERLIAAAGQRAIPVIAQGISVVEELCWLREHGAAYLQGYVIARPAPAPAARLARL